MRLCWDSYRVLYRPLRHFVGAPDRLIGMLSSLCSYHRPQSTTSCIERMLRSQSTCEGATASPGVGSQSEGEPLNAL